MDGNAAYDAALVSSSEITVSTQTVVYRACIPNSEYAHAPKLLLRRLDAESLRLAVIPGHYAFLVANEQTVHSSTLAASSTCAVFSAKDAWSPISVVVDDANNVVLIGDYYGGFVTNATIPAAASSVAFKPGVNSQLTVVTVPTKASTVSTISLPMTIASTSRSRCPRPTSAASSCALADRKSRSSCRPIDSFSAASRRTTSRWTSISRESGILPCACPGARQL